MALTGLDIFKQLPKTNCKECGSPTCLAFAMAMANGKASLDMCPHASEAAKEFLGAATAPPVKTVKVGVGEQEVVMGDETVLFRHDKTFYHPTALAIQISDTLSGAELDAKIEKINGLVMDRVGQQVAIQMVAVTNCSKDAAKFKAAVEAVAAKAKFALLLAGDLAALEAAVPAVAAKKPLIHAATAENWEKVVALAKANNCPVVVKGNGLDDTAALVEKVAKEYKELVLDFGNTAQAKTLAEMVNARRLAIKKKFRPFGYPMLACTLATDAKEEVVEAATYVAKYASIICMKADEKHHLLPLMAWRMNVYTDPQKPMAVEGKVYEIGDVTPDCPVYVCTNFALTYFAVEGEVVGSKIPGYIVAVDTDGSSVLTGWASGKFVAEPIYEFVKNSGVMDKVNHNSIVIPGYVAIISGKLKEISSYNVIVGPQEAVGIPAFAKANYPQLMK
ncbi:acetyl-CoA decarbonylase/synthase complex subunit gamma [Sporomusa acidovorans]|uniref:Corrinoid/iron-sulfur protein large subunit n=1 Tax=Sporomusa acidovorans (strain ATCC 49682 / DSM 3132 / Mol) TaxID=1123286 RepID=A0ABZ3J1N5_SPOA4|nr:acetyl-CoA decarbonylase/synthase complex subunit gamma [Sporomusa acidovorans]OZC22440.1 corrinoid/iron-sulfur protein large subunit [Sporomusa acidovorans DSM 3132]SDE74844.1 CO-methylating acetyl-CoA synthase corrinoid iron-sulfur protein large subunit precursor [Sporomusa acidovorans]